MTGKETIESRPASQRLPRARRAMLSPTDKEVLLVVNKSEDLEIDVLTIVATLQSGALQKVWSEHMLRFCQVVPDATRRHFLDEHHVTASQMALIELMLKPENRLK
ncbi:hypothetical protein SAMN05428964_105447 [Thalassospira xiamenensis]|uniref:Uncharacterized protein n=1 Tax=Thalassospira xiamenensis TaxID=220697 RepID=A0A285TTT2_9PROT|nr:hypothetical protein SAMN05428964_105447 [Thalassospira xiamenensis]